MMSGFDQIAKEVLGLVHEWEPKLLSLNNDALTNRQNTQNRTIKEIIGHLVDSASNNTHRMIHLQYQKSPCLYPDYANLGNNDRWISIQNYREEEWVNLVELWKFTNLHLVHVIQNVKTEKLQNQWISALNEKIALEDMITDYPRHLEAHLLEVVALMDV